MRFNIISNLSGNPDPSTLWSYNETIAFNLRRALRLRGHEVVLVSNRERHIGRANHTIVTSNLYLKLIKENPELYTELRRATAGNLCLWLDSDFGGWYTEMFDRILTVCRQSKRDPHLYRFVGWAADGVMFRSEQSAPTVSVDSYMRGFYEGKFDALYDLIESAVQESGLPMLQPVSQYNAGRVKWTQLAETYRRSTHYILTQPAFWGWTNIEAATCGALLLVHRDLDKPKTWPSQLNHRVYSSREELLALLHEPVDVAANRAVALENTWAAVADRVLGAMA